MGPLHNDAKNEPEKLMAYLLNADPSQVSKG